MTTSQDPHPRRFIERLDELRVVNGVGPATRLGGLGLHAEVRAAMARAVEIPVRMADLERAAGAHVANLLGVPAAYVTAGAAAALTLAAAAAIARDDAAAVDSLPHPVSGRREFVIQSAQRDPYDRAIEAAGGRIVAVGYPHSTHVDEIKAAIDENTAALIFRPGASGNHVDLARMCDVAHDAGLPVIVDGALRVPPLKALHGYLAAGADMVAVSGGKLLRGPQASGLLCGAPDWIARVGVHHQDMDEHEETWPDADGRYRRPPRHGIARMAKVGREQLVGLVTAVERFVSGQSQADGDRGVSELRHAHEILQRGSVDVQWNDRSVLGSPELLVRIPPAMSTAFVRALRGHHPPVYVEESRAWEGVLSVNALGLTEGDGVHIAVACENAARMIGAQRDEDGANDDDR